MEPSAAPTRCSRCGAAVPPQAPWCTLCLASTGRPSPVGAHPSAGGPAPSLPSVPSPRRPSYGDPGFDPLTAPAELLGLPPRRPSAPTPPPPGPTAGGQGRRLRDGEATAGWPCSACGAANPLSAGVCGSCGSAFLAGVRTAEGPLLELPVVGDLSKLQRSQRLGLAFVVLVVVVVLLALLGLLLS